MNKRVDILWCVWLVGICLAIFGMGIFIRAGMTQWNHGDELIAESDSLVVTAEVLPAQRGSLFTADGRILSTTVKIFSLHMDFKLEGFDVQLFTKLLPELCDSLTLVLPHRTSGEWQKYLEEGYFEGARYYLISNDLMLSQMKRVKTFPWFDRGQYSSGLIVEDKIDRMLPFEGLAARTIGYTRQSGDSSSGIVGLEQYFNQELEGEKGIVYKKMMSQQVILPDIDRQDIEPDPGLDIHTTLDIDLQDYADATLRKSLEDHKARFGCVVMMEVETGNILSMVNLTRNKEGKYTESYNHAVGTLIEPGSTMKIPVMAALLEKGLQLTDMVETHKGDFRVAGKKVPEATRPKKFYYDPWDVIKYSSNIGISQFVQNNYEDNKSFYEALYKQFPRENTGITLQGEQSRNIPPLSEWNAISKAWMSFGYGLELTPLDILTYYNAIANKGVAMQPRLVTHTSKFGEVVNSYPSLSLGERVRPETAETLTKMMQLVVEDPKGTAHSALSTRSVSICGKTGTTKIADDQYGYEDEINRALFCGFFPVDKPQYSMIVLLSHIDAKEFEKMGGGSTAGPVFGDIAEFAFAQVGNKTSTDSSLLATEGVVLSTMFSDDWKTITSILDIKSEQPLYTVSEVSLNKDNSAATLNTSSSYQSQQNIVPNLIGMGLTDAVTVSAELGFKIACKGYGHVKEQWPSPGSSMSRNGEISLVLK